MQDDVQDGYLIPKGSLVIANISYVPCLDYRIESHRSLVAGSCMTRTYTKIRPISSLNAFCRRQETRFHPTRGTIALASGGEYAQVHSISFCLSMRSILNFRTGLYFADASVWITCAMTLAAFDISKAVENGKIIEPTVEYTSGVIRYAFSFPCMDDSSFTHGCAMSAIQSLSNVSSSLVPRKPKRSSWRRVRISCEPSVMRKAPMCHHSSVLSCMYMPRPSLRRTYY